MQRQWQGLVQVEGRTAEVLALGAWQGKLLVGGIFKTARRQAALNIAIYDEEQDRWEPLMVRSPDGVPGVAAGDYEERGTVYALALRGDTLWIGGDFRRAGDLDAVGHLLQYNLRTGEWQRVGEVGVDREVRVIVVEGDSLYVIGGFRRADTLQVDGIAVYDLQRRRWWRFEDSQGKRTACPCPDVVGFWYRGRFWSSRGMVKTTVISPDGSTASSYVVVYDPLKGWQTLEEIVRNKISTGITLIGSTSRGVLARVWSADGLIKEYGTVDQNSVVLIDNDDSARVVIPGRYMNKLNNIFLLALILHARSGHTLSILKLVNSSGTSEKVVRSSLQLNFCLPHDIKKALSMIPGQSFQGSVAGAGVPAVEAGIGRRRSKGGGGGSGLSRAGGGGGGAGVRTAAGWGSGVGAARWAQAPGAAALSGLAWGGQQRERLRIDGLASGVYHWRLRAGSEVATGVLVVVR